MLPAIHLGQPQKIAIDKSHHQTDHRRFAHAHTHKTKKAGEKNKTGDRMAAWPALSSWTKAGKGLGNIG